MKIAIAIPNTGHFGDAFVNSLANFMLFLQGEVVFMMKKSALVYAARNEFFAQAKSLGVDYLLMIDSDMVFPQDALKKMIALDKDIVTGVYHQKVYPFRPNVYMWTGKDRLVHKNIVEIPDTPFRVDSCGGGFLLISKRVLQELDPSPFDHIISGGYPIGEDTSFCMRVKDKFEIWAMNLGLKHSSSFEIGPEHFNHAKSVIKNIDKNKKGLDGWTSEKELEWLADTASNMTSVAEIGSWKGRSTLVLLQACKGKVYAVDHFEGSESDESGIKAQSEDVFKEFIKNVGHYPNLEVLRMDSKQGAKRIDKVDMVFIDADHDEACVKADIETWLPKTNKIICGHDYNWPGVQKAVSDTLGDVTVIDTIWYKEVA
jgi:predicted O-methyltransferase YrrM